MSTPQIALPKQPIAIRTDTVMPAPTTLRIKQHDKGLTGLGFSVTNEAEGTTVLTVDGKIMSWTQKRAFRNASGLPLFELYRKSFGGTWLVELPGQRSNGPMVRLAPRGSMFKDKIDVFVRNAANGGETVNLEVRGQDIWKLRTNVYLGDDVVMSTKRTDKLSGYIPGKSLEWLVDIAEGFDASLAAVVVVVLSATLYDSSMTASISAGAIAGAGAGAVAGGGSGGC